jgi:hypothetical protein
MTDKKRIAIKVDQRYAIIKRNPIKVGDRVVLIKTKQGENIALKQSPLAVGDKVITLPTKGKPIAVKYEELLDQKPKDMEIIEL